MNFVSNMRTAFAQTTSDELSRDRGDLVQTIIITAGFAIAGFLLVNWLSTAILNKGAEIANCIEGSSSFSTAAANTENCQTTHEDMGSESFKDDDGFKDRFN